jgi:ribosomal protein S12 methylthiotransferase
MIAKLGAAGWELSADPEQADTVVVNTCAFIDPAKEESTDAIMEQAQRK